MTRILIIDDDSYICNLLEDFFSRQNYYVETAQTAKDALNKIELSFYDIVFCDNRLPDGSGLQILNKIKTRNPETYVIIISAYADISSVVQLMKSGAYDYSTKPLQVEDLLDITRRIIRQKNSASRSTPFNEKFIIGESDKMKILMSLVEKVAPTDLSVLIEGETGSGKEYIARSIHLKSKRKDHPFIAVDCGAIPQDIANSELFGHVRGSFTGAINDKAGVFEQARGGTIFLDEIGNLDYSVQIKLLRALQERDITRVGGEERIKVDVRVITATNENLENYIEKRNFREDLFHRINEFKLRVPALRERKEDILIYANHFRDSANKDLKRNVIQFDIEAVRILQLYPWYGNLRELRNVIKRAVLMANGDTISSDCFPDEITAFNYDEPIRKEVKEELAINENGNDLRDASNRFEKQVILTALKKVNYNKSKAARLLNIDRKTLYNKMKALSIHYK